MNAHMLSLLKALSIHYVFSRTMEAKTGNISALFHKGSGDVILENKY
jgi:hypothetical protein